MNSLANLLFPAILLAVPEQAVPDADAAAMLPAVEDVVPAASPPATAGVWAGLAGAFRPQAQNQVRIERRVIIRINPQRTAMAPDLLSALPQGELPPRYKERKFGKCVEARSIAGVQAQPDNRLLLFLRDRRILLVTLEKSCPARNFYSGFYVEPNKDGKVCTGRDKLHSRSGANCELDKFRELVASRH